MLRIEKTQALTSGTLLTSQRGKSLKILSAA